MSELRAKILPQLYPLHSLKSYLFLLSFSSMLPRLEITKKHNKINQQVKDTEHYLSQYLQSYRDRRCTYILYMYIDQAFLPGFLLALYLSETSY